MSKELTALDKALERACLLLRDQPDPMIRAFQTLDAAFSIVPSTQVELERKIDLAKEGCEYLADISRLARGISPDNLAETVELADNIVREVSPLVALCFPLIR